MPEKPLTYESIMKMIRGISRATKEQGVRFDHEMRRTRRLMEERDAEYAREKKERDAEYDRMRKELNRKIGDLGNRIGDIIEHMLGERIIEKFQALGYNVTHPVVRNCSFSSAKLGIYGEFDLTLVDSDIIILIEVKTTLETADVPLRRV